jgi:hypothetical protein
MASTASNSGPIPIPENKFQTFNFNSFSLQNQVTTNTGQVIVTTICETAKYKAEISITQLQHLALKILQ